VVAARRGPSHKVIYVIDLIKQSEATGWPLRTVNVED
jgi:hypothetical protein